MQETINHAETHFINQGRFAFMESDVLGKGATGTVYKGYDTQQNTHVAIKVINTQVMNQIEKNLIQNQKKALISLKHPNIMKLIHIQQQPSYTFIISQLYQGGTLQQHLTKRGCFDEFQAMEFFSKIVSGYCAIVEANIIHRDLKPMNVLLTKYNQPVIIDFGYSQIIVANRNLTVFNVGSPSYMSPQAFTKTIYSEKSDVWSLGAIFYQLLTKKTLDDHYQTKQYFQLLKNCDYPPIEFDLFADAVKEILMAALAVRPQQRATANRIKYLLDKEILGKKFKGKIVAKTNENRPPIPNTKSMANFVSLNNNNIELTRQKDEQEKRNMVKRPSNKNFSSIPMIPQPPKKNIAHSSQNIRQTRFMKQQDCIIEKESQSGTNSNNNSFNGSLKIIPTISRIEYKPTHQHQRSNHNQQNQSQSNLFYQQNSQLRSIQNNSISTDMIQLNSFNPPRISRQTSFNSNSSDSDFINYQSQHGNNSYMNNNGSNQIIPSRVIQNNKSRQQLFFSNQINQPQRNQINYQQSRPNIPLAKHFQTVSEKFVKGIPKVGYNENSMVNVTNKYSKPVNIKQLSQKLDEKAAVQFVNQINGMQNYWMKQPQKVNQTQKLYQSQQTIPYQKVGFQQQLRTSINPQIPLHPTNHNNNQILNLNLPFGQSLRSTINPQSSRTMIRLKQNA